jgi:prolyl oligopeptidase PreP (S9A serine peptidase family)
MKIFFYLVILLALISCTTTSHMKMEPNQDSLNNLGISTSPTAPLYPFEEFYKTAALSGFEFKYDKTGAYILKKDGKVDNIFEYDFKTKKIRQLTYYQEAIKGFLVDPNGKFLVIQKDLGGSEIFDLHKFDLITKKTTPLTNGKNVERSYLCAITDDGKTLYFSQSREKRSFYDIKSVDLKTGKTEVVLAANKEQLYCSDLSDDNKALTFSRFIENNENHVGYLDLKTKKHFYIIEEKAVKNGDGLFSNNDKEIYFLSTKESDKSRIWKYSLTDNSLKLEAFPIDNDIDGIGIFSKGEASLVRYRGELAPKTIVYNGVFKEKMSIPVGNEEIKGAGFHYLDPKLSLIVTQNGAAPKKYYLFKDGRLDLLYNSNQSKIADTDFSKSYSTFVSSFDGLKVPVNYFIPNGTSIHNKKPVIFWIHGGPEDNVDPEYSPFMQYLVNQGYVLVAPNVRGSTGFGKAYQFKDNGDWGGGHIKDIIAVAEATKKLDFVDSKNMFILGGSFGGFSVMSLITQYPKTFKAAVNIFGPIEFSTFLESWPDQTKGYWIGELGFDPRVDKVKNQKVSPLFHIDKIQIPLQVHQGANDIRVLKSQSDQLIEGMKKSGKQVEYYVYEDEGHGFTKFENSKACFTRIDSFFKKALKAN